MPLRSKTRREALIAMGIAPFALAGCSAPPDKNTLLEYLPTGAADQLNWGNSSIQGRQQRDGTILAGQTMLFLAIFGQSNTCNVNPSAYTPTNASVVDEFNIYNGGTYESGAFPALGCSRSTLGPGNPFKRLADKLVTAGTAARVIRAHAGIGATTMAMWGSDQFNRVKVMGSRLSAAKIVPSAVLYQQGETDAGVTSQANYTTQLNAFIAAVRLWYAGPIFIAQSSWNGAITDTNITNAQASVLTNVANGIWSLGNMDQNTTTWRQPGGGEPHLNDVGADAWATAMQTALHAYGAPF